MQALGSPPNSGIFTFCFEFASKNRKILYVCITVGPWEITCKTVYAFNPFSKIRRQNAATDAMKWHLERSMGHVNLNLRARLGTRPGCRCASVAPSSGVHGLGPKMGGLGGDCSPARAGNLPIRGTAPSRHPGRPHHRRALSLSRDAVGRPRLPLPASSSA